MKSVRMILPLAMLLLAAVAVQAADSPARLSSTDLALDKPPSSVTPPAPDPSVILQGGDTCATATVITSLPYSDSGTTSGFTHDYDEICPYSGSTAPDVAYSFTPASNMNVDITLCVGSTNYDTKLYVYQGSCPGTDVGCNDDQCSVPVSYTSELTNVALTGGQTYYIIVDGYGGGSGNYTLEVSEYEPPPPPPECPPATTLHYQTVFGPNDAWNAFTSAQSSQFDYEVVDLIQPDLWSITDFHWWGLSLLYSGGWSACNPTGLTFDLTFYADAGGQPGAEVCSFTGLTPTFVNTGVFYSIDNLYYWEVTGLSPACQPSGPTWVSVKSYANAADCAFLWMNGSGGTNSALQWTDGAWAGTGFSMSMCVTGTIVPVELQSFDIE
ncbi:MAG TPA: hypothetical protein PKJ99_06860 [Thermoanaerobaculales bacterium]|nr:hypothetical protein [Thermoanaerobaculales bacterium]HPA81407.1 hypothetical protein [Thermoanaerobaculales bacterium]HQL30231.1 hypothetical protein [Thermoanaerobaculales bacterium]HQN97021.1 hypothetical protein [Thermoanaerobaculales bacterium]HQP42034.1 hypothetical protein [Thermoanaerobaculales bacterium]